MKFILLNFKVPKMGPTFKILPSGTIASGQARLQTSDLDCTHQTVFHVHMRNEDAVTENSSPVLLVGGNCRRERWKRVEQKETKPCEREGKKEEYGGAKKGEQGVWCNKSWAVAPLEELKEGSPKLPSLSESKTAARGCWGRLITPRWLLLLLFFCSTVTTITGTVVTAVAVLYCCYRSCCRCCCCFYCFGYCFYYE